MSVVQLARLAAVVLALLGVVSSAITWVPSPWHPELVVPGGLLAAAGVTALLGWWLGRRPPGHWARRSGPVWLALGVAAVVVLALALAG